ncbi:uncharacterized protein LOC131163871 [Malania oleifera]|uniref:uncharacterized protein LOC131163871 n=1 Tax=Malania oleifera TaxID=397392 RepID=UPI0025AE5E27|nr:uncharacterized protein LOC131163871 [Malania oleifera]
MSSTPRKRLKPHLKTPKSDPINLYNNSCDPDSPSSSSSFTSLRFLMEPSSNFFPSKDDFFRLLAVLVIAASVAMSCNFIVGFLGRQPKPFCDSNGNSRDSVSDVCEPCPNNGECYQGKLECVRGYRKHGNLCVEDGDISEAAKKLSEWVEMHVCEAYAQFLCDGIGTVWVREDEIWNDLDESKLMESFGLDRAIYGYAKQKAMEKIGKLLEKRTNLHGIKELKCPEVLVEHYKPFICCIKQWISKHALVFMPSCILLLGCALLLWRVHQTRYLSSRAEQIYHQVCDVLEENALMSKSMNGECEPWVIASWLRDHLLLPRERKDPLLWKKVEEFVQEDSRLDRYPRLVKGESKVVWEWQVEGSLRSSKMRKKLTPGKLKSSEPMDMNSNGQLSALKDGGLLNC